jgi:hypothetical protein
LALFPAMMIGVGFAVAAGGSGVMPPAADPIGPRITP